MHYTLKVKVTKCQQLKISNNKQNGFKMQLYEYEQWLRAVRDECILFTISIKSNRLMGGSKEIFFIT